MALVETVGGPAFYHELARTEIAYKIGADRPDEAIKIIEGIKRNQWSGEFQAEAFGWLAVALAPRDRARAFGLIDRALAMMIENRDWMAAGGRDGRGRPHRPLCAADRLPRHGERGHAGDGGPPPATRLAAATRCWRVSTEAALALALIDPETARTVLEQMEARSGLDPCKVRRDGREPWLIAWALVDLKKAEAIFEAGLTELDGAKEVDLWNAGFFPMVEFLAAPPDRREEKLGERSSGGYWWPGRGL